MWPHHLVSNFNMSDTTPEPSSRRAVRIGGASGFWGDSVLGATQLAHSGLIDYLVFDYLAELTMSILAEIGRASCRERVSSPV